MPTQASESLSLCCGAPMRELLQPVCTNCGVDAETMASSRTQPATSDLALDAAHEILPYGSQRDIELVAWIIRKRFPGGGRSMSDESKRVRQVSNGDSNVNTTE